MSAKLTLHEIRKLAGQFAKRWEEIRQEASSAQGLLDGVPGMVKIVDYKRVVLNDMRRDCTLRKTAWTFTGPPKVLVKQKSLARAPKQGD
ncbi:hypothetical protein QFZ60_003104 [Arthrobacter sp. B2I5]|uniref:hypothetical protein n=1 Tax=Arthrobacter sp. B2I5 TaxID=3042266 RepID=UPI002789C08C|nr:hypothetical protein [Arthrobacter sp. B2I5]MDQ0826931.1 hypothetical protein [Arthrobacter sp. B2I5]